MWIQSGDKEPIIVQILDILGNPLLGKTDIKLQIRRRSDDYYYDWSDDTFKNYASVIMFSYALEELTNSPGQYRLNKVGHVRGFNTATILNSVVDDVYFFTVFQEIGTDALNVPQIGQLRTGGVLDDVVVDEYPILW